MPNAALRPCPRAGCPELVVSGYCARHTKTPPPSERQQSGPRLYDRAYWKKKVRPHQLSIEPLCRHCAAKGIVRLAQHVDHIDGDETNNDPSNLQSLCKSCHSIKTAKHDGGFGNLRK